MLCTHEITDDNNLASLLFSYIIVESNQPKIFHVYNKFN